MPAVTSSSSLSAPKRVKPSGAAPLSVLSSSAVCAEPPSMAQPAGGAGEDALPPLRGEPEPESGDRGLDGWPLRRAARVLGLAEPQTAQQAETVLRLMELGFLPGQQVRVVACGAWGREPLAVRVGGSTFALRRHEAALVRVGEVRS